MASSPDDGKITGDTGARSCWQRLTSGLLGMLILWQLCYLGLANGIETLAVVTRRFPEAHQAITKVLDESRAGEISSEVPSVSPLIYVVDKWGQVAQQPQRWSLFAPNVGKQTGFLALELCSEGWQDSVWWYSEDEPQDPAAYWRFGGNRMRSVEQNLAMTFSLASDESEQEARHRWASRIEQHLATNGDVMLAWIKIRLLDFAQAYPNSGFPDEVIIHARGFEIPAPNRLESESNKATSPNASYSMPIARWFPAATPIDDVQPLEAYNPETDQFVFQPYQTENLP